MKSEVYRNSSTNLSSIMMQSTFQAVALLVLAVSCLVSSIVAAPLASDFCPSGSGIVDGSCRRFPSQDNQAVSMHLPPSLVQTRVLLVKAVLAVYNFDVPHLMID